MGGKMKSEGPSGGGGVKPELVAAIQTFITLALMEIMGQIPTPNRVRCGNRVVPPVDVSSSTICTVY